MDTTILEVYRQLSTFELLELHYMAKNSVQSSSMGFITLVFAFLTAAFLAGRKLSQFQVISVSVLYSLFVFFTLFSMAEDIENFLHISYVLYDEQINSLAQNGYMPMLFLIWGFSLFFMHQTRRK